MHIVFPGTVNGPAELQAKRSIAPNRENHIRCLEFLEKLDKIDFIVGIVLKHVRLKEVVLVVVEFLDNVGVHLIIYISNLRLKMQHKGKNNRSVHNHDSNGEVNDGIHQNT